MSTLTVSLVGSKGGVGTSTTSAAVAVLLARSGLSVHLVADDSSDVFAVLGVAEHGGTSPVEVTAAVFDGPGSLYVWPRSAMDVPNVVPDGVWIFDGEAASFPTMRRFVLVEPSFLSLRRAARFDAATLDGFVLVEPFDGVRFALTERDAVGVLHGVGLVASFARSEVVARAIDSGLLLGRFDATYSRALRPLVDRIRFDAAAVGVAVPAAASS